MELKHDAADLRVKSEAMSAGADESIELELYDELIAFSVLPVEQRLQAEPREEAGSSDEIGDEFSYPEIVAIGEEIVETPLEPTLESSNDFELPVAAAAEELSDDNPLDESFFDTIESDVYTYKDDAFLFDEPPAEIPKTPDGLSNTGPLGEICPGVTFRDSLLVVCTSCGNQSDKEDMFCIACGEFLDEAEAPIKIATICIECETIIGNEDIFCPSCGAIV